MPSVLFVTTVNITLRAFLLPFADHFREQGWTVDAMGAGAAENPTICDHFDHVYDIQWSRRPFDYHNLFVAGPRVRRIVEAGGYDIVHVHTPIAAFVTRFALRRMPAATRPQVVYTAHGFHFYEGGSALRNALYHRLESTAAKWTDDLVVLNAEDLAAATRLTGIDPNRVRLIKGIGVDTHQFAPDAVSEARRLAIRRQFEVPPDAFVITMLAEFAPVKRHAFAIEAMSAVTNSNVHLVFVGKGPLFNPIRDMATNRGLSDRVHFLGYRNDVPAILGSSDALMLVSEREGLPRSILEAMSMGLPILGTKTRGIVDEVTPKTGWLAPKHDPLVLARLIDEAASDPEEARRRGAAARERVIEEFALDRIIADHDELYTAALARRT